MSEKTMTPSSNLFDGRSPKDAQILTALPLERKTVLLGGVDTKKERNKRLARRVIAGAAATLLVSGIAHELTENTTPGTATEKKATESMAEGESVERADFAIRLAEGVNVRKTPRLTRIEGNVTDENLAYETTEQKLIIGPVTVEDENGTTWYGIPNESFDPQAMDEDDIGERMDWVSNDIIGQLNENGERYGEIYYPGNDQTLSDIPVGIMTLLPEDDPQQVLTAYVNRYK